MPEEFLLPPRLPADTTFGDLVDELARRHRSMVLITSVDVRDDDAETFFFYSGNRAECLGLLKLMESSLLDGVDQELGTKEWVE